MYINNSDEQILFLKPVFKERILGGSHLRDEFNYNIPSDKTGECWGLAAHDIVNPKTVLSNYERSFDDKSGLQQSY